MFKNKKTNFQNDEKYYESWNFMIFLGEFDYPFFHLE